MTSRGIFPRGFLALGITALLANVLPAAEVPPITKVVRRYAITSANDFPQRDPQDWKLLGSNDGGTNWVILDIRKGEVFPNRHQRIVFATTNHSPFNLYRLQIDKVRDPADADSAQVAEIEPLGETDQDLDPAPFFNDVITAQEDNPPWESRFHAFDGRVETKWLDRAPQNPSTRACWIQWQYAAPTNILITNLGQLRSLRWRAGNGYTVRIEAIIAGWLRGANTLSLVDPTGHLEIPAAWNPAELRPGQRVILEGASCWTNEAPGVTRYRLGKQGPLPPDKPRAIAVEQPLSRDENWIWVEVEGKAGFCTWPENRLVFELQDQGHTMVVQVLHLDPGERPQLSGARVRVQGICDSVLNTEGQSVAGTVWVPDMAAIRVIESSMPPSYQASVTTTNAGASAVLKSTAEIRRLTPEQLMRRPPALVRGVITEIFGAYLQDGDAAVELWYGGESAKQLPEFGSLVEAKGTAGWAPGHGPIVRVDTLRVLGKARLPVAERCSFGQLARMADQWVEIQAVVRSTDGSHLLLSCEGGQLMATIRSGSAAAVKQLVDATVRARGVSVAATDSRGRVQGIQLLIPSLEQVEIEQPAPEPFSLPTRSIGSLLQVSGSRELIHRVKVEGVLTLQEGRHYFLQDATGSAMAIGREDVILTFPSGGHSWFFWQTPPAGSDVNDSPRFEPGDQVEVVGFPETRGFSPTLTEVVVRKIGTAARVKPVSATMEAMARGDLDSSLVSLEAVLLRRELLGKEYILDLQSGPRIFQAFLPSRGQPPLEIAPGSRLRVEGVCQVEPSPYAELGQRVASFKLLLGSAQDLILLQRPSWWTLSRALMVAGALVVVLAMAGAWIGILRKQVEERTRELQQEVAEHERTEGRLAEETKRVQAEIEQRTRMEAEVERGHKELLRASRMAGMAEVATSVLHNVGNVLNGVNVLATSIADQVKASKASSVRNVADLLAEHREDVGRFMSEDNRGRQLPGYVDRLGTHLETEQVKLQEKIKALTESVQHIKEIVAMQQNYAKVFGHQETVALSDVVEDALRMHSGAMTRHHIEVVRDFEPGPAITVDRHKVLQILFNLFENAKYACAASGQEQKRVTVQLRRHEDRLQIRVTDNGVGIPPENLPRIFDQDFSTRKDGHGFGLHSSLLAAQEMGGSLTARSEGLGKGATFVLELPINPT